MSRNPSREENEEIDDEAAERGFGKERTEQLVPKTNGGGQRPGVKSGWILRD
jgi:hypothetical protein